MNNTNIYTITQRLKKHNDKHLLNAWTALSVEDKINIASIAIHLATKVRGLGVIGAIELLCKLGVFLNKHSPIT